MPLFTVIIPTYNRAALISAAIESALAQRFRDFELIVVDDGSTDETGEVVRNIASHSQEVRYFRQENAGPGAARNLGIQHAAGEYVTFLDSDDLWFPWTLSTFQLAIEQYRSPSFIAGTDIKFHDEAELRGVSESALDAVASADFYASRIHAVWIGLCAVAIRTDVLREVGGFNIARMNAEDTDLWLRLGVAPGFVCIRKPALFAYRQHSHSEIANRNATHRGFLYLAEQERSGNYPGGKQRWLDRQRLLSAHLRVSSLWLLQAGKFRPAISQYRSAFHGSLRCGHLRFLIAFPILLGWACMKKLVHLKHP